MNDLQYFVIKSGGLIACLMMAVVWFIGFKRRNAGWVDFGWVLGLVILAVYYALAADGYGPRRFVIAFLVGLWGMRLGGMLLKRLLTEEEDKRYQKFRQAFKSREDLKFFFFFEFQAILDVVLSIPFFLICFNSKGWSAVEWVGIFIWAIGFMGESAADQQLKNFKADPRKKGNVCEAGLWYYSRHPNYFFEWVMWVGYFVMALSTPWGWIAIIAPLLMLHFLLNVSGVPLAEEQSLRSRGERFKEYQRTTSVFIPLSKRKI